MDIYASSSLLLLQTIGVKLRAHNDFYSQSDALNKLQLPRLSSNLSKYVTPFAPCPLADENNPQGNEYTRLYVLLLIYVYIS